MILPTRDDTRTKVQLTALFNSCSGSWGSVVESTGGGDTGNAEHGRGGMEMPRNSSGDGNSGAGRTGGDGGRGGCGVGISEFSDNDRSDSVDISREGERALGSSGDIGKGGRKTAELDEAPRVVAEDTVVVVTFGGSREPR